MAQMSDFFAQLWHAVNPDVPLNPEAGLYRAWAEGGYRNWGSPIAAEGALDDGTPVQVFSGAIVKWTDQGAVVYTDG